MLLYQHYPPGTQEFYNSFSSRNLMMKNSNELESSEGRGGVNGSGIREADSDDRRVPLHYTSAIFLLQKSTAYAIILS